MWDAKGRGCLLYTSRRSGLCRDATGGRGWGTARGPAGPVSYTHLEFVLRIVAATRTEAEFRAGVSVRGGLALKRAAQARALLQGRDFVVPEDVQELAAPVLAHRLALARPGADALEERHAVADTLRRILAALPPPV